MPKIYKNILIILLMKFFKISHIYNKLGEKVKINNDNI